MFARNLYKPINILTWSVSPRVRNLLKNFEPKVRVNISKGGFTIKTATTAAELLDALSLRYKVFYNEYQNKRFSVGLDHDEFDAVADHLLIIDDSTQKIVGTYRLISSKNSSIFYSETEFELSSLKLDPRPKLELGRACIKKEYRKGSVISLLWRGIAEYARVEGSKVLFGCSSVKTTDPMRISLLMKYLEQNGHVDKSFGVRPLDTHKVPNLALVQNISDQASDESVKSMLPGLVETYLKMGGKILGSPAIDRDFGCIDLLTFLDLTILNDRYTKRYIKAEESIV